MLEELRIRGLGVIEDAVLPLGPGLTVVTGETGAGKTMVVTGLLLLFGGRADAARVRSGADQASVDGILALDPGSPVLARVHEAGGDVDDGNVLPLRRLVSAAGRSRAHVGGAPAPVSLLAELADRLVAVHGQSDQLRLTRPARQRETLDRYAGVDLGDYLAAYQRWRDLDERLTRLAEQRSTMRREAELLAFGLAEIDAAAPQPGEDIELAQLVSRLSHAEGLTSAATAAHDALAGDPGEAVAEAADVASLIGAARRELGQQAGNDPQLDAMAGRLDEVAALAADLAGDLATYRDQIDGDPLRLEAAQTRISILTGLARKYAEVDTPTVDGVLSWADTARARHAELDVSDERLAALSAERDLAASVAAEQAALLSERRSAAADQLGAAVTAELSGLAMPAASLVAHVRPRTPSAGGHVLLVDGTERAAGPDGTDDVELLFRAHPDNPELPLGRGASGGELSRVMLALEVCLAGTDPVPTMVFDEVDAGVGGRAAVEVGKRLARLASDHQVLVVTHLAQVAAFADRHIVVDRPEGGEGRSVVASDVREVAGDDRIAELARMLAGSDSPTAREHAAELVASARTERAAPRPPRKRIGRPKK